MDELRSVERAAVTGAARRALLRRLIDVVALPGTMISPQDRAMAGDVLMEMLFNATKEERLLCAQRLVPTLEAPRRLLRYLAQCEFDIAKDLLEENESFDASDLTYIIQVGGPEHRAAIAQRRKLTIGAGDALAASHDPHAVRLLLRNPGATLSELALDAIVIMSRENPEMCGPLVRRPEIKPSQAMAMFWWADGATRREILRRHAGDRNEIIERCADVFPMAAEENWSDPVVRKTLQLIERRQRNRAAIEKSPFDSLEQAIEVAEVEGLTPETAQEIGFLAGIKPVTVAQILSDVGGEGIAVLCKATGLRRGHLQKLWKALRRETETPEGEVAPRWAQVSETYETLSVARAQTTLRYWNWSMSASFSPKLANSLVEEDGEGDDEARFSTSRRTAKLVFGVS